MPLLSIITVNYNNCEGLKRTINSVFSQVSSNFEYLIIDGGSVDGSKELIAEYSNRVNYWISEKDKGIYNAMNKGIMKANGDYVLFLNSGDILHDDNVLAKLDDNILKHDIIYFNSQFVDEQTDYVHQYPDILSFNYFLKYSLPHQASLIRRTLFDEVGLYDENYKICSDWAFFLSAFAKHNASYQHIDRTFAIMYRDGISTDPGNLDQINLERQNFLNKNFSFYLKDYSDFNSLKAKYSKLVSSTPIKVVSKLKKVFGTFPDK